MEKWRSPPCAGEMFTTVKLLKAFGPTFYMLFKECFAAFFAILHKK
jgi:hypothetical protein